jgi:hypothetical protein
MKIKDMKCKEGEDSKFQEKVTEAHKYMSMNQNLLERDIVSKRTPNCERVHALLLSIYLSFGVTNMSSQAENLYLELVKSKLEEVFPGSKELISKYKTFMPNLIALNEERLNVIVQLSQKPILMIDPMNLGKHLLKQKFKGNGTDKDILIFSSRDPNLGSLMIEGKERQRPILVEKMGSKVPPEILNHEASQFFLSTLLDNPNYSKEIFERFTVVNIS